MFQCKEVYKLILTITLNPSIDRRYVVDGFEKGKVFRAKEVQYTPGGKGINVTKVIKFLGEPVMATGFLGGRSGEYIEDELDKMYIKHKFININGETRSCIAILSDDKSQTEVLEDGPHIGEKGILDFYEFYEDIIDDFEIICASGSLPEGVRADTYRKLIGIAKKHDKKFILDTSGEALKLGIEGGPFLVKPNKEELEKLVGYTISNEDEIAEGAKHLLDKGINIVVVSLGFEGAMAFSGDYAYKVKVPKVNAVNPVGSGDSMVAGFAVSILRKYDLETMLRLAAACGTANAMEKETGKVNIDNVKRIMRETKIEKMKIK